MNTEFHFPTQAEIEAQILAARRMRSETIARWIQAGFARLTHPHLGLRHT